MILRSQVRRFFPVVLSVVFLLAGLSVCEGQSNVYVKIDTSGGSFIEGESTNADFNKWIEAETVSFGISSPVSLSPSGISSGKAVPTDLVLTKLLDKSSPYLFLACAQGTRYPTVTINFATVGFPSVNYFRITLTGVVMKEVTVNENGSSSRTMESLGISYETIKLEYFLFDGNLRPLGPPVTASWNFVTGTTK